MLHATLTVIIVQMQVHALHAIRVLHINTWRMGSAKQSAQMVCFIIVLLISVKHVMLYAQHVQIMPHIAQVAAPHFLI